MNKDERIAELEMQIKELQDDNRNLRKGLNKEGLDYFITQINNIRHEICEKVRLYCRDRLEPVPDKLGCIAEINRDEFFEGYIRGY